MQYSKTIYFSDHQSRSGQRTGLTIPFSQNDESIYRFVEPLSSYRLRKILGFELYAELERAATQTNIPPATFARGLIEKSAGRKLGDVREDRAASLQATFRGGKGSPLHDWYPYLEGYSPDFVSSIIKTYAPSAKAILDPFCGSGTTALVAAIDGRDGLYTEVNPACRYIIAAKAHALRLAERDRQRTAKKLREIAATLPKLLKAALPDKILAAAFTDAFGNRPFFSAKAYDDVLRLRTMVDEIAAKDKITGEFLTVAVLRSLVAGSLLIRRGDLRFRTDAELGKSAPDLRKELCESIEVVASDLLDASVAKGTVTLIGDDARELAAYRSEPVDAIITSPPYLNGTNYFRNTKIELWFLRFLASRAGLRQFRDAAITSGINDVTQKKSENGTDFTTPASLASVLKALDATAYDQRIPLMVQSYFQEMDRVVCAMRAVSGASTSVAIDLGDSCYGSVWVPTDLILAELMEARGFRQTDRIVLRERQSRDGRKLCQTLQIFDIKPQKARKPKDKAAPSPVSDVERRWSEFRDNLPHQRGEMAKRNWGHSWHSLCSYQGKLKPSIARALTEALLPATGGKFLDPFSGVGTIPFEARLQGHTAYGFDISPAAVAISKAKLEAVAPKDVRAMLQDLSSWIAAYNIKDIDRKALAAIRFNGPLPDYFHAKTLNEIAAARAYFQAHPVSCGAHALVFSSLLHILHGNRPYALSRRSHPITPFAPTGPTEYRGLIDRLTTKVERCLDVLETIPDSPGCSFFQDATAPWPKDVKALDAIITSPPFFDSTRFHTANWMRLWFAGWDAKDFASKPSSFVDERQKKSFEIYEPIFAQARERLKSRGYFAIHLGKSRKCDMAASLTGIGEKHLTLIDSFSESVGHCESHGIRDKGTVTHHQYLLFQKR